MVYKFNVTITLFGLDRTVHLYLPQGYEQSDGRYPVLYFYDGHNLFSDQDATYGKSWGLGDYLDRCGKQFIAAGIECNHEGNGRLIEYCPFDSPAFGGIHGQGQAFMRWVVEEFKPMIDARYRTLPGRENTMIAGSSMGGLMAAYSAVRHNDVFSKAACLSPSLGVCLDGMTGMLEGKKLDPHTKIYLDWGSREAGDFDRLVRMTCQNLAYAHMLTEAGASCYPRLVDGGEHCEASWERQIPVFMEYLWG